MGEGASALAGVYSAEALEEAGCDGFAWIDELFADVRVRGRDELGVGARDAPEDRHQCEAPHVSPPRGSVPSVPKLLIGTPAALAIEMSRFAIGVRLG